MLLLLCPLLLPPAQEALPPLAPLDVFELERVSDPRIAPDGSGVAFVRLGFDILRDRTRSELWYQPLTEAGAAAGEPRPLWQGAGGASTPRWSPDGGRLAFLASDGDRSQVHVLWMDTLQVGRVTHLTESPGDLTWSPDGRWISFSMFVEESSPPMVTPPPRPEGAEWAPAPKVVTALNYRSDGSGYLREGHRQLFLVPSGGGTPRQLTEGPWDHGGAHVWHPSGEAIVLSANRREDADLEPNDSELWWLDLADGELRALTDRRGPDRSPALSPDGERLAWLGFDDRYQGYQVDRVYVMELEGGAPRELASELDRSPSDLVWRGGRLYASWDDRHTSKVGSIDPGSGEVRELVDDLGGLSLGRPYSGGAFSVSRDGRLAYTRGAADALADLAVWDPAAGRRRLTDLNGELFSRRSLAPVEELWVESSHDGLPIQAWIALPPDFDPERRYPLLLEIHGGPFASYGARFAAEIQLYAAAGYVVVWANPRGSTGYGEAFGNAIHHAYPGHDFDDLMSVVDAVLARGSVDPERLYVTGGSGGGVLTAWIVGTTDRFRAAVVAKPVIHWTSFVLTADAYAFFHRYWFPGLPWEHHEHYWQRSPLSRVGNVSTPTMLLTGEEDHRTPISETEQYYQALRLRGVDTAMVRIPGASHGIAARPSHLIAKVAHVLAWFERHGGPEQD